jgi:hypothetical protein
MGRLSHGREQWRAALQLDPLSPMVGTQLAVGYCLERRYANAVRERGDVLDLHPAFWGGMALVGRL